MSGHHPLDPGVPARKRSSYCKFCLCIGCVLFGLLLATYTYLFGFRKFDSAALPRFSHSRIFQNQTLEQVENRGTVVRPLVDDNQSFDIAVSIWVSDVGDIAGRGGGRIVETPLYSDIVFRGLRLADKHKSATIRYTLPVAMFRSHLLIENDLRASFVLIPKSPSLLDQVTNFSTWRPETLLLRVPSVRSWPFPLGAVDKGPPNVADRALDSFGISMPLLEFHQVSSKCTDASTTLKRHPFVVTRTQIQVVDETHVFNRELYNKEHNRLRSTSCGQRDYNMTILALCNRSYFANGNWETRLELQTKDENTGESQTEWAYAPYMGHAPSAAGPKDIVAVPVTRENCTQLENSTSTDPDSIEIDWQLSYSGRSPLKFFNGLVGHRFYEDAHPRRRVFLDSSIAFLYLIQGLLDTSYWYTRTSTLSISVSGTVFLVLSRILFILTSASKAWEKVKVEPLFMLKTVTRLAFSRRKTRWMVSLRRVSPTHAERTSQRLDLRTSWAVKACICLSLAAIDYISFNYYSFSPFDHLILAANHPPGGPNDGLRLSELIPWAFAWFHLPLRFTGLLSQLLLNQRSKTYGGSYKITAAFQCICRVLHLLKYVPSVIGRYDARRVSPAVFPRVIEKMEDEDTE
ncbi:hypothetical protein B0H13DRAFT_2013124 [Mycena leptocephala]|nr:hypothetical protein B0H13DRAFT_2013124 [Mycena leptocephala]